MSITRVMYLSADKHWYKAAPYPTLYSRRNMVCVKGARTCIILPRKLPAKLYIVFTKKPNKESFQMLSFSKWPRIFIKEYRGPLTNRFRALLGRYFRNGYRYFHVEYYDA